MKEYNITLAPRASKSIRKLPKHTQNKVIDSIESLTTNPRPYGVKKLNLDFDCYRIRCGDYRIVYEIDDGELVVLVLDAGDRKDIYSKRYKSLIRTAISTSCNA